VSKDNVTKVRMFAAFQSKEHQENEFNQMIGKIPKKYHWSIFLYLGMMDSTIAEGFADEKEKEKK
jgi:hypothetical protein